jgi:hypothetical protein
MDRCFSYRQSIDANAETRSACDVAPLGTRIDGFPAVVSSPAQETHSASYRQEPWSLERRQDWNPVLSPVLGPSEY